MYVCSTAVTPPNEGAWKVSEIESKKSIFDTSGHGNIKPIINCTPSPRYCLLSAFSFILCFHFCCLLFHSFPSLLLPSHIISSCLLFLFNLCLHFCCLLLLFHLAFSYYFFFAFTSSSFHFIWWNSRNRGTWRN